MALFKINKLFWLMTIAAFVLIFSGCGKDGKSRRTGKLNIVVTTGMIADAVENICKEHANVTALMGPGVDPHLYKASEGDVSRLDKADVIVYNGLHLEGKMGEIFYKMSKKRPVLAMGRYLPEAELRQPPEFEGQFDPHIWFDQQKWSIAVLGLGEELANLDSLNKEAIRSNTQDYLNEIAAVNEEVLSLVSTIPEEQRVLITAHDAFGYFGDAYGVEVIGLQGISTVSEYGLQDITNMVDLIVERNVKAIFVESSVSSKSIEAVQSGAMSRGFEVKIGGTLYSDALGDAGTEAGTYLGMVRSNLNTIVSALR